MNSKHEKEQDEHRETVITGQIEKRSASTAHHTLVLSGVGRPREIEKGGGNQSGDISDDNNTIQSSDETHDEESQQ